MTDDIQKRLNEIRARANSSMCGPWTIGYDDYVLNDTHDAMRRVAREHGATSGGHPEMVTVVSGLRRDVSWLLEQVDRLADLAASWEGQWADMRDDRDSLAITNGQLNARALAAFDRSEKAESRVAELERDVSAFVAPEVERQVITFCAEHDRQCKQERETLIAKHAARKLKMRARYDALLVEMNEIRKYAQRSRVARQIATMGIEMRKELSARVATLEKTIAGFRSLDDVLASDVRISELERKLEDSRVSYEQERSAKLLVQQKLDDIACAGVDNVWFWQGEGDRPESISCPVVMSADTMRAMLRHISATEQMRLEWSFAAAKPDLSRLAAERWDLSAASFSFGAHTARHVRYEAGADIWRVERGGVPVGKEQPRGQAIASARMYDYEETLAKEHDLFVNATSFEFGEYIALRILPPLDGRPAVWRVRLGHFDVMPKGPDYRIDLSRSEAIELARQLATDAKAKRDAETP